jgi:predicted hotdog family 3-hydroxylacyl-ACP dehydratase
VQNLLPHGGRALLLDRVLTSTEDGASCEVTLNEEFPYLASGSIPAACALELLAQTAGVFSALERLREPGSSPVGAAPTGAPGYLVGVPAARFLVASLPQGVPLTTRVVRRWRQGAAAGFDGEVLAGERPLVTAELRVFEPQAQEAR